MASSKDISSVVIKNKYYPNIKESLDKNKAKDLISYIPIYIDKNENNLFNAEFNYLRWRVDDIDGEVIFKSINSTPAIIKQAIVETKQTEAHWKIYNKPEYWAIICIIKYFQDLRKTKEMEMCIIYFALMLYSSIINARFKYPPNPNIMRYTINNLNNRYDIKKYKTIFNVLQKLSTECHNTYKDYLTDKDFCDLHIKDYLNNMYVRINNFVKKILEEYIKNKNSKRYMNTESDSSDPENYYETNNISGKIYQLSENCANTVLTSNLNLTIVETSAKIAGVSVNEVKNVVSRIIEKDRKRIKEFILLFLHQYLIVDKHPESTFMSSSFLVYVNKIYSKSNTNDTDVIRMKQILDEWLKENSEKYLKTERVATLIAFRKSIMLFFCIATQQVILNKY